MNHSEQEENFIRSIVVAEVHRLLSPLTEKVDKLDKNMRSLYSNGSGGPPGYLENARAEDDKRYKLLFDKVDDLAVDQREANRFIVIAGAMEASRAKFRASCLRIGWKLTVGLCSVLLALATWAYHVFAPVVNILWKDYLLAHPVVMHKLENISRYDSDRVYAKNRDVERAGP